MKKIELDSHALLVINRLEKSLNSTIKLIRILKNVHDEDDFARFKFCNFSACEYLYLSPAEFKSDYLPHEHDFFSMAEEEYLFQVLQILFLRNGGKFLTVFIPKNIKLHGEF